MNKGKTVEDEPSYYQGQRSTKASPQFVVRRYITNPNGPQWCEIMPRFGP
jgi:hypothetical protein